MKSKMQKRGVTSRTKALSGISDKLRDGSEQRNRDNDFSKEDRSNSYSKGPGYKNMERSAQEQYERRRKKFPLQYGENIYGSLESSDRFNEYAGSRHQANPDQLRYGNEDEYFYRYMNSDRSRMRPRFNENAYTHKSNANLEYNDYMNRGQYEKPFHGREIYDPIQSEYDRQEYEDYFYRNRPYRYEGYQSSGNVEGFGRRGGRQSGRDWREEEEYRQGHAPRQRGYGKFGSR